MSATLPRGWRRDAMLQQEAADLYRARTGQALDAELCLSPRMAGRTAGVFRPGTPPRIALSRAYLELCDAAARRELILHELAHYHLWRQGLRRGGHGQPFRALMRAWGFGRYPDQDVLHRLRPVDLGPHLLYVCPNGHQHWLRRPPRSREVSCGLCSRRFDRRYLLRDTGVRQAPSQELFEKGRT
jgi:predicted SprT family Zn-dependent metalloprotease